MSVFEMINQQRHEKIIFTIIEDVRVILGIHDTTLGPAVGGTRILNYKTEEEALFDVTRLSYGMTLKNAAAGLSLGGGKAVLIGDPEKIKTEEFFKGYGEFLNSLNGIYYTAEDVNISTKDIDTLNKYTKYVTGTSAVSDDPSPYTAKGVYNGIKAAVNFKYKNDDLKGKVISIQGLGNVGYKLCKYLYDDGAILKVFDIDENKMNQAKKEFDAELVDEDEVIKTNCDIFAPCALGAVINEQNVNELNCDIIAGSANNVLLNEASGKAVFDKKIIYVPDYIINAGGVINCGLEVMGVYNKDEVDKKIDEIYNTVTKILNQSKEKGLPTNEIADEYALDIINKK